MDRNIIHVSVLEVGFLTVSASIYSIHNYNTYALHIYTFVVLTFIQMFHAIHYQTLLTHKINPYLRGTTVPLDTLNAILIVIFQIHNS